jgi:hypothetical protein
MSIDPTRQFDLIAQFFESIPKTLGIVEEPSKTDFARNLLALFQILELVEPRLENVIADLEIFANEPTIGMRVHYIHRAGGKINSFEAVCIHAIKYIWEHSQWYYAFNKIASPKLKKIIENTKPIEDYNRLEYAAELNRKFGYEQAFDVAIILKSFAYELQAVRSPDPKLFPDQERILEIIENTRNLRERIRKALIEVCEYAENNLMVVDFFRGSK